MNSHLSINSISSNPTVGYTPEQIKRAYSLSNESNSSEISVGIIDFMGNIHIQNNLDVFSKQFNLPYTKIEFFGDTPGNNYFDFQAYVEPCADTQWVHAISPNVKLKVFRAYQYSVEGVIESIKQGLSEKCDIILQTFQAPFLEDYTKYRTLYESDAVFVCSAGDYGAGAFFPSCFPSCISVGGTSLLISDEGERIGDETVWRMTGGGICEYFNIPSYQSKFNDIVELTSGKRGVPDISFLADPDTGYSVYHSSVKGSFGWYKAGGTSLAASVIAGIISNLLSQNKEIDKKQILNYIYDLAGRTEYTNPYSKFYDIVKGENNKFEAKVGYDLCTGLGSLINL